MHVIISRNYPSAFVCLPAGYILDPSSHINIFSLPCRLLESSLYFGLEPSQVHVFSPDLSVPLLNEEGKVALESPYKVARAPGGTGKHLS